MDFRGKIIEELNKRIDERSNLEDFDAEFALQNFLEWFMEEFIY